jgi:hypothetical protein
MGFFAVFFSHKYEYLIWKSKKYIRIDNKIGSLSKFTNNVEYHRYGVDNGSGG